MTVSYKQIIVDAMAHLGVFSSTGDLPGYHVKRGLTVLNGMLHELSLDNVCYSHVDAAADDLFLGDVVIGQRLRRGFSAMLALELRSEYGAPLGGEVSRMAMMGRSNFYRVYRRKAREFDQLPPYSGWIWSGNRDEYTGHDYGYYRRGERGNVDEDGYPVVPVPKQRRLGDDEDSD